MPEKIVIEYPVFLIEIQVYEKRLRGKFPWDIIEIAIEFLEFFQSNSEFEKKFKELFKKASRYSKLVEAETRN